MQPYEVKWSHEAVYDAADISDYIESSFGSDRADKFEHDIDVEVEKLGNKSVQIGRSEQLGHQFRHVGDGLHPERDHGQQPPEEHAYPLHPVLKTEEVLRCDAFRLLNYKTLQEPAYDDHHSPEKIGE